MTSTTEPLYFQEARRKGEPVVSEPPKFDLESYIANYRGKTRIYRLLHIGTHSSYLYHEAMKLAIDDSKSSKDVQLYVQAVTAFFAMDPNDPDAQLDQKWVERTTLKVKAETDQLQQELKGYKNNLIKESIRMAQDDLGRHYQAIGLLGDAINAYIKERESCQSPAHLSIMHQRIISAHIEQNSWLSVESNVQKMRHITLKAPEFDKIQPKLTAALGLACLATKRYKEAADAFLNISPSLITAKIGDMEGSFSDHLSANDIANYGGLCALASMDRVTLQRRVLNNSAFRNYLELEPQLRRAISAFVNAKYSTCLGILEAYEGDYLLDMYMCPHLSALYGAIRAKSIVQYFEPFSRVKLSNIAAAFDTSESNIEEELVSMISDGQLDARIDLEHRLLVANGIDERSKVHAESLQLADAYRREAHMRILRMNMITAGLDARPPKEARGPAGGSQTAGDLVEAKKQRF